MKFLYTILILIFLVPFASASANVVGLTSTNYNLGDQITLSGSTSYPSGFTGYLNLIAECSKTINLDTVMLDLKQNQEYRFSKTYTLTNEFEGTCSIKLKITDSDDRIVDEADYGSITISKDLSVLVDSRLTKYQLGDTLNISGLVSKQKTPISNGIATLIFKEKDVSKFIESVKVTNGKFEFSRSLTLIPAGEYTINIKVQDEFGNEKLIEHAFSFSVNNKIYVTYTTSKPEFLPGENFKLAGNARGEISDSLTNVELRFNVDGKEIERSTLVTSKQQFSFEYALANNIKSGLHNLTIFAKDDKGNANSVEGTFYVKAIPTTFRAELITETDYLPEDTVKLRLSLFDQAEDSMQGLGTAVLSDPANTQIDNKGIALGTDGFFLLPQFAKPGVWTIEAEAEGLKDALTITVVEQSKIDTWIEGQTIYIRNLGNIPYEEELKLVAENDQKLEGTKKISLDVDEVINYDLAKFFPTGTYRISVLSANESFDNIKIIRELTFFEKAGNTISGITGGAVYGVKTAVTSTAGIIVLVLICLVLIAFGAKTLITKRAKKKVWSREVQLASKRKTEIMREKGQIPSVNPKRSSTDDPEMKSFVQSLVKRANEEPQPFKPIPKGEGSYINLKDDKPKEKGGSVFGSMFDF